jgi:drug/metabolite transporter (DMT)-like permease
MALQSPGERFMPIGVVVALLSYSVYSLSDSLVKSFGSGTLSAFEINFFLSLFSLVSLPFARSANDSWRDLFRFRHPWLMSARALLQTMAAICFTVALTRISFAETYSLVFLTPLFLTLLSVVVLKEQVAITRWLLVAASFVGVLIVVRPGFHEFGLGQAAAVACAFAAAASNMLLRIISNGERHTSIIALNAVYQLIITGALMLGSFVVPSGYDLMRLAIAGGLSGAGQLLLIRAMQRAPASQIGPTNYVQILWAVALGAVVYGETQDAIGYGGLVLIVIAGVVTVFSDGAQARIAGRWAEYRARRGEPATIPTDGPDL